MTARRSIKPVSGRHRRVARPSPGDGLDGVADSVELAKLTLQIICRDRNAPSSARAQAARTLLEVCGALRNAGAITDKSASEMSSEELDQALAKYTTPDTPV